MSGVWSCSREKCPGPEEDFFPQDLFQPSCAGHEPEQDWGCGEAMTGTGGWNGRSSAWPKSLPNTRRCPGENSATAITTLTLGLETCFLFDRRPKIRNRVCRLSPANHLNLAPPSSGLPGDMFLSLSRNPRWDPAPRPRPLCVWWLLASAEVGSGCICCLGTWLPLPSL